MASAFAFATCSLNAAEDLASLLELSSACFVDGCFFTIKEALGFESIGDVVGDAATVFSPRILGLINPDGFAFKLERSSLMLA